MNTTELKKLAEAATPGPWVHWTSSGMHQIETKTKTVVHWSGFDQLQTPNERGAVASNAAYIAAANPAAIMELLEVTKGLAEALNDAVVLAEFAECWITDPAIEGMSRLKGKADKYRSALAKYEGGEL